MGVSENHAFFIIPFFFFTTLGDCHHCRLGGKAKEGYYILLSIF